MRDQNYEIQASGKLTNLRSWLGQVCAIGIKGFLENSGAQNVFLALDANFDKVVCISSEMHDYQERGEAGQLCLKLLETGEVSRGDLDHFWPIETPQKVQKIRLARGKFSTDSGLVFSFGIRNEFVIVAAAHPFFLSVLGLAEAFEATPEFAISCYAREEVFSITE